MDGNTLIFKSDVVLQGIRDQRRFKLIDFDVVCETCETDRFMWRIVEHEDTTFTKSIDPKILFMGIIRYGIAENNMRTKAPPKQLTSGRYSIGGNIAEINTETGHENVYKNAYTTVNTFNLSRDHQGHWVIDHKL